VRINVEYVKIMGGEIYFNIKSSARIEKKTVPVSNIELTMRKWNWENRKQTIRLKAPFHEKV